MTLHYESYGSGQRTLVFVHYFGGDSNSWKWVTKRLKRKFHIVTITLPGFGRTTPLTEPSIYHFAKYINACLNDLELKDFILCGHSMGAKLVLYATQLRQKSAPMGIVLVAPSPPTVEEMPQQEKERMLQHPNHQQAEQTVDRATCKRLPVKRRQHAIDTQLAADPDTWSWWLQKGMTHSIADRIPGVVVPTYVICAKKDPVISMNTIFEEVLPHLHEPKLMQLGKCGHLIPLESPRKLARQLKKIARTLG